MVYISSEILLIPDTEMQILIKQILLCHGIVEVFFVLPLRLLFA